MREFVKRHSQVPVGDRQFQESLRQVGTRDETDVHLVIEVDTQRGWMGRCGMIEGSSWQT